MPKTKVVRFAITAYRKQAIYERRRHPLSPHRAHLYGLPYKIRSAPPKRARFGADGAGSCSSRNTACAKRSRGLESVSHIWLLWLFSAPPNGGWSPTVRPPRLAATGQVGVFATRSPNRPNPIGLTCVKLEAVEPGHARRAGAVRFGRGYAKRHAAAGRQALPALCRRAAGRLAAGSARR